MIGKTRDSIALAVAKSNIDLWRFYLGHMSEKGMKMMCLNGKLSNLMIVDIGLC